jgi:hypothetical protein
MIEARGIAETDGVGGRKQAERGVRANNPTLVEKRKAAGRFQTRWITNITSGRPASYSSNTSATLFW